LLIGYLLGAIHPAYIFAKCLKGVDLRAKGTGKVGTSNLKAQVGSLWPVAITALYDTGKGALSLKIAQVLGLPLPLCYLGGRLSDRGAHIPLLSPIQGRRRGGYGIRPGARLPHRAVAEASPLDRDGRSCGARGLCRLVLLGGGKGGCDSGVPRPRPGGPLPPSLPSRAGGHLCGPHPVLHLRIGAGGGDQTSSVPLPPRGREVVAGAPSPRRLLLPLAEPLGDQTNPPLPDWERARPVRPGGPGPPVERQGAELLLQAPGELLQGIQGKGEIAAFLHDAIPLGMLRHLPPLPLKGGLPGCHLPHIR